ncbi:MULTISPECIES: LytR/AlgR family response regulator transcription factor [Proteiniphilum]|uniref:LytR/AlgR family response regulator transcription factor n=1 Tax=Proteiniphilum TaxID=294702 RepID=UPI001EE9DB13|nr:MULTISPECIES: LytTR family DNA-binding domain-containing protein [Proteiniphilum]
MNRKKFDDKMDGKIPAYLYDKKNSLRMILFTALFALLFINLFQPFGSRDWYPGISDIKYFAFSSLIILTGMLVVVISRVILIAYSNRRDVLYWQYALWILCEIVAMAIFYTLFAKFFPKDGIVRDISEIFRQSLFNTTLVLLLPYLISWLYFSWKEKSALLEHIGHEKIADIHAKTLIAFPDEKGDLKISIMLENLLYIESADNYATIYYLNKSRLSRFLIRNSLKWMEENLTKETPLVRCHRSYIVNIDKVKILKKIKGGLVLELDAESTPDIPVSKTYYEEFMNKFSQYTV